MRSNPDPRATSVLPTAPAAAEAGRMGEAVGDPYGEHSTFQPGFVLQDRFRILRFIARGGAGEVYEAFDTELRCPVALKLVRPEVATNESAIDRFRREIALARQVTHPNVSRIFDVFRVEIPARGPSERSVKTLFLSMELLVGESLAGRIRRLGPLKQSQALPLIIDMIEGLKAAHRAGVIHRDLKSANVMLARSGDEVRAVIMDFGLALDLAHDPDDPDPLTNSGVVVGTPNYMAPEQLTGGDITPAVDQYSLGIVIFEMLTGQRPFRGENEVSTAVKRLTEPPPSPRSLIPELDLHWERAILRMLDVDPSRRFPSLDDIIYTLVGTTMPIALPGKTPQRRVRPSFLTVAGGLVLVAIAIGQAAPRISQQLFGNQSLAQALIAEDGTAPLTIGSIRARVVPPEYSWISTAFAGLLAHNLHGEGVEVSWVPGVANGEDLSVTEQRTKLNAPLFVGGSYDLDPALQRATVELNFLDDATNESIQIEGPASDLEGLASLAAARIRSAAGLDPRRAQNNRNDNLLRVAARELRSGRNLSALRLLEEGDVDHPGILAERSRLLLRAGDLEAARDAANGADTHAASASDRRLAQAAIALVEGNPDRAASLFGELEAEESGRYSIRQAEALLAAGQPAAAIRVLNQVESTPEGAGLQALLLRLRAENDRGAHNAALQLGVRAETFARGSGADWTLAEILGERGRAHLGRGEVDQARQAFREADQWLQQVGGQSLRVLILQRLIELEESHGGAGTVAQLRETLAGLRSAG